ncbi:MAG: hypothetical protein KGL92_10490, partial [Gammaproteobacteria bacterium]|nr:hypothetical protein [Gammaproteobacteria bacterium]
SFLELPPLMLVMEELDGLLQPDGDEETNDNRGDMDEETLPDVNQLMRSMCRFALKTDPRVSFSCKLIATRRVGRQPCSGSPHRGASSPFDVRC